MSSARRITVARWSVVAAVALAAVVVLVQLPRAMQNLDYRADRWPTFSYEDAEFGVGNSIVPDKQVLYEARALIPEGGRYWVVTGEEPIAEASEFTRWFSLDFARYFLMPRRLDEDASWIICIGCTRANLPRETTVVWTNNQGSSLLRAEAT